MRRLFRAVALSLAIVSLPSAASLAAAALVECPGGCDDRNPCTTDTCDPSRGCVYVPNDASCSDGNSCTLGDRCQSGACVGATASTSCSPCQAASILPPAGGTFLGATAGSSRSIGSDLCRRTGSAPERVYRWTPSASGTAEISTCGTSTSFDTVVYVRRSGCLGGQYACSDDGPCRTATDNENASRLTMNVVAGQTYFIYVDGFNGARGNYALTVVPPGSPARCGDGVRNGSEPCDGADAAACNGGACSTTCTCLPPPARCGDGVRNGSEPCDGADAAACASRSCYPDCTCIPVTTGRPDLVPEILTPYLQYGTTVPFGDVQEQCASRTTGIDLFRFGVRVTNRGSADLFLGNPACPEPCDAYPNQVCGNPQFVCAPAGGHNHGHYQNYADYALLSADGTVRVSGHKQGFCLHDGFDSGVPCPNRHFDTCEYQGLSVGCGDLYEASLGCQYVEITALPPGQYTLRVTVDPLNQIPEDNEGNNVVTIPVTLPDRSCSAVDIPAAGGLISGTTSGASAQSSTCGSGSTGPETVYRWVPSRSGIATLETCGDGTDFDTVLHVRKGSCYGPEVACNDDGPCAISNNVEQGSRLSLSVEAGAVYYVFVDGYAGGAGRFSLKVTLP